MSEWKWSQGRLEQKKKAYSLVGLLPSGRKIFKTTTKQAAAAAAKDKKQKQSSTSEGDSFLSLSDRVENWQKQKFDMADGVVRQDPDRSAKASTGQIMSDKAQEAFEPKAGATGSSESEEKLSNLEKLIKKRVKQAEGLSERYKDGRPPPTRTWEQYKDDSRSRPILGTKLNKRDTKDN